MSSNLQEFKILNKLTLSRKSLANAQQIFSMILACSMFRFIMIFAMSQTCPQQYSMDKRCFLNLLLNNGLKNAFKVQYFACWDGGLLDQIYIFCSACLECPSGVNYFKQVFNRKDLFCLV